MLFNRIVLEEKQRAEDRLSEVKRSLKKAKGRELFIWKNKERFVYYWKSREGASSQVHYCTQNEMPLVRTLAKETLLYKEKEDLEQELAALKAYMQVYEKKRQNEKHFLETRKERFERNPGYRRLEWEESSLAAELKQWMEGSFVENPRNPEKRNVKVTKNLFVRSKSEAFIAQTLLDRKIPFRYEAEMILNGYSFFPDFTIRHPKTGDVFLWEHFGLMDYEGYAQSVFGKMNTFVQNGFVPDINLIMTFETGEHPLDYELVRQKAAYFFS